MPTHDIYHRLFSQHAADVLAPLDVFVHCGDYRLISFPFGIFLGKYSPRRGHDVDGVMERGSQAGIPLSAVFTESPQTS